MGVNVTSLEGWVFSICQENYKNFLMSNDTSQFCSTLTNIIKRNRNSENREILIGFLLPKLMKRNQSTNTNESLITPSALVYKADDSLNTFLIQSYSCAVKCNTKDKIGYCKDCYNHKRNTRGNRPGETIPMSVHKKILKKNDIDAIEIDKKNKRILEKNKVILAEKNKTINRLRKKICYWRLICIDLRSAVAKWREVEHERKGFICINEIESENWFNFYSFIDKHIELEHGKDEEKMKLHKELIRSEMSQLGKFNKKGDKRGIRTTKISSRILNYSLGLAHKLGKHMYEEEATFRSLPSWSTLTR